MPEHSVIFKELSYVFIAAILGGALAWRLRQPLILGYVLAGIAISPFTPGPAVREAHTFQIVAEVGVVFLMFSIGLEFSLDELLEVKWVSLIGGPLGVVLLSLLGEGVGMLLGWGAMQRAGGGDDHLGRQYHGAVAAADRQRATAVAARQGDDRHHAGGRPGRRGAHHPDAGAGQPDAASSAGRGAGAGQGRADSGADWISGGVPGAALAGASGARRKTKSCFCW